MPNPLEFKCPKLTLGAGGLFLDDCEVPTGDDGLKDFLRIPDDGQS